MLLMASDEKKMDGCFLIFYVFFNKISAIPGRWAGDKERMCAEERRLRLKRSLSQTGLVKGTDRTKK